MNLHLYIPHNVRTILTAILLLLFSGNSHAQSVGDGLGTWNIINAKFKINNKFSLFLEPQLRSLSFYNNFHYYEIKGGATYNPYSYLSLNAGLGNYNTYSEGGNFKLPHNQLETRTWLQLALKGEYGKLILENRWRAEQRFTNKGYKNRYRYRLNLVVPLNSEKIEVKTVYLSVWNELFFTNQEPYFERNRFFVGIGYELNHLIAIQTGYVHQFDYKITDEIGRDFLQISLLFNFDLQQLHEGFQPTLND